jgi:oligogalacturonide lyase
MIRKQWLGLLLILWMSAGIAAAAEELAPTTQSEPPTEWIEPTTGHRVVQLSREPGSASLYFHQYPFSADGKKMVFTAPSGIWTVNLDTHELDQVVKGRVAILTTGRKSGDVYFMRRPERPNRDRSRASDGDAAGDRNPTDNATPDDGARQDGRPSDRSAGENGARAGDGDQEYRPQGDIQPPRRRRDGRRRQAPLGGDVYAANLDTHEERHVASLSKDYRTGNVAINSDETTLVVIGTDPKGEKVPRQNPSGPVEGRLLPVWASGDARVIYTINLATGETNVIHQSNDWLNHLQCSPTDPQQILFCHEGPWQYVDRTWLIRTDGTGLTQVHPRSMDAEIGGHEFFSNDGKTVWYDLQTPRSLVFWLAGYDIATGKRTWYNLQRDEWSVHYNVSPDGKLFAGDGGGPGSVANRGPSGNTLNPPGNGTWIYLFRPELDKLTGLPEKSAQLVKPGLFHSERLVDMSQHDYNLEPNVIFTPDGKWIVFRSNMHGKSQVYAVEIARAD